MSHLTIHLGERSYTIVMGSGLLAHSATWQGLARGQQACIISDSTVAPLYAEILAQALAPHYAKLSTVVLPEGEQHKDWQHLQAIFDHLIDRHADRKTVLYALGGGVVGDMAGFAAAVYMRGVPFVQVPTTLLAQVDSSVGGKTGIDHPLGKNMIGAFYQPLRVVCDFALLRTLPTRQYAAGLAEVIKYGLVADMAFLHWLERHMSELLAQEPQALRHAVQRSCEIKAGVVEQDEREAGLRAILNFGHTFGHAIETGCGYGHYLHGEAVAVGMVIAARLSAQLGLIDHALVQRLIKVLHLAGLPTRAPDLGLERYWQLMHSDKKNEAAAVRFVLLRGGGNAVVQAVAEADVAAALAASL